MKMKFSKEREIVVEASKKILEKGLTVGAWGNVSTRISDEGKIVITPSGMNYQKLSPEDMIVVDLHGKKIEGKWKPSSEMPMHLDIYKAREEINAIIHTHPIFSSVLATLRKDIPPILEDMVMLLGGKINVAEYALPGTKILAENVVKALGDKNAVLLANHGSVCVGTDMEKAFTACEVLEKSAQVYIYSKFIGEPISLTPRDIMKLREASVAYLKLWMQK
jgi:L-fuculose-phosphate aldolase